MKIGYLGPRGTFTEEALLGLKEIKEEDLIAYPTVIDSLKAADNGEIDKAFVPVENSIEGSVNATLDTLTFKTNLNIEKEIVNDIHLNLIANAHTEFKDITKVSSLPIASAQCQHFLSENLPSVPVVAANSTAEAAKMVAEENGHSAAIANQLAADIYELKVLKSNVEDFEGNQTRFLLLGKEKSVRTGNDKTSIACFISEDRPGSLFKILQEFAGRNINLTKIQSRPTKEGLGKYYFWIDLEGHIDDKQVNEAITSLKARLNVKFFGSYPRS